MHGQKKSIYHIVNINNFLVGLDVGIRGDGEKRKKILINSFLISFLILITCLWGQNVLASNVLIGFDVAGEPDVVSYRIFYGTESRAYSDSISVEQPGATHVEATINGLTEGKRYYFAVKAIDAAGQESDASAEASLTIPYSFGADKLVDNLDTIDWLETGSVEVGDEWTTVNLSKTFTNPVVIVSPVSANDSDLAVVRVANVTGNSFAIRVQEWDYLDGIHEPENLSYIVVEAGVYRMPDGTVWQAGTCDVSGNNNYLNVDFSEDFVSQPVVFATVQTENESDAVVPRLDDVRTTGFRVALEEQESFRDGHGVETVGYLAVEKTVDGFVVDTAYATDALFSPSGLDGIFLKLEEEQSKDSEVAHTMESIGFMKLGGLLLAQIQTYRGGDPCTMRYVVSTNDKIDETWYENQDWIEVGSANIDDRWVTISTKRTFTRPVVIIGPPTYNGADPSLMRVRNVGPDSFELRLQEWNYNNGGHTFETVSWMVIEAGTHTLPDGTVWEAGLYEMDGTEVWKTVNISTNFGITPLIFQTVQTENGYDAVTTRLNAITGTGFKSLFDEEEARNNGHVAETVGYLAVPLSSPCDIGLVSMKHNFVAVGNSGKYLMIEEERSKDSETWHTYEDVGYLGLGDYFFGQIQTYKGSDPSVLRMK